MMTNPTRPSHRVGFSMRLPEHSILSETALPGIKLTVPLIVVTGASAVSLSFGQAPSVMSVDGLNPTSPMPSLL